MRACALVEPPLYALVDEGPLLKKQTVPAGMGLKLFLLAILVAILTYLGRRDEIDDALIYARYIGNALAGRGLVFNTGEHVNALTSPLFTYLLLGASWFLKGKVLLATVVLSGIFLFGAVALAERLVPFAGFLVAGTSYFYTLVGMESAVFLFMLVLIITLYQERQDDWIPLVSILLILTRFEGAAMVLFVAILMVRERRYPKWSNYVPVVIVAALYLGLNYRWFGHAIPSSATSKLGQGRSGIWGRWPRAFAAGGRQLIGDFLPIIYIVPLVIAGDIYVYRRYRHTGMNQLVLGFCGLALAFYVSFNLPGYRWYFAPFIFFGMICACEAIPSSKIPNANKTRLIAGIVIAVVTATSTYRLFKDATVARGPSYPELAECLNANTLPTSRIEASETGTVGWYAPDRYIIDILGLTTPKNAVHIAHHDQASWLAEDHPDFVIVHDMDWSWETVVKRDRAYVPVGPHFGNAYILQRKSR